MVGRLENARDEHQSSSRESGVEGEETSEAVEGMEWRWEGVFFGG